ncbi:MAG TPA: hypothetical protein P5572_16965 [Phycisphaerae bacterium]|nr:hypothetical protein [Phycisphaerae bacterium]
MLIVTFSGVDGCGKSTQVERTAQYLADQGLRVRKVAALRWSVAGIHARIRDAHRLRRRRKARRAQAARGADTGAAPAQSEAAAPTVHAYAHGRSFDADRRTLAVRIRRHLIYPLDCVMLAVCVTVHWLTGCTALVFDRYTFDKMVGLPNPDCRLSRLLVRIAPRPTHSFFIDTPPEIARARRPEHTADYHPHKSAGYRALAALDMGLTAVPPGSIEDVQQRVRQVLTAGDSRRGSCAAPRPAGA